MTQTFNVGSRSRFVTVTAWVFIVLGAMATVWAGLQNATVASMATSLPPVPGAPLVTGLLLAYLPWVVGAGLVLSVATLTAAVVNLTNQVAHLKATVADIDRGVGTLQSRLDESWAAAVLAGARRPPATLEAPTYEGRARVFGQAVTFTMTPKP